MDYQSFFFFGKYFSTCCINLFTFSKGSIVAEFKLTFNENGEPKEALEMFKEEINDGNLGTLRVDPSSLELIPSATEGDFVPPFLLFSSINLILSIYCSADFKMYRIKIGEVVFFLFFFLSQDVNFDVACA